LPDKRIGITWTAITRITQDARALMLWLSMRWPYVDGDPDSVRSCVRISMLALYSGMSMLLRREGTPLERMPSQASHLSLGRCESWGLWFPKRCTTQATQLIGSLENP
jgi:hypothetical protein